MVVRFLQRTTAVTAPLCCLVYSPVNHAVVCVYIDNMQSMYCSFCVMWLHPTGPPPLTSGNSHCPAYHWWMPSGSCWSRSVCLGSLLSLLVSSRSLHNTGSWVVQLFSVPSMTYSVHGRGVYVSSETRGAYPLRAKDLLTLTLRCRVKTTWRCLTVIHTQIPQITDFSTYY